MPESNLRQESPAIQPDELHVGAYAMKRMGSSSTLVRIKAESDGRYSVGYVRHGGGSAWHGADSFAPVTDPVLVAICKADEAARRGKEHDLKAKKAHKEAETWRRVADVLRECPPDEIQVPEAQS